MGKRLAFRPLLGAKQSHASLGVDQFTVIHKPKSINCWALFKRSCSDWTQSIESFFAAPRTQIAVSLPSNKNPYDLQDLKGVRDLIGAREYSSVEDFKKRDEIRWARVLLGLPKEYTNKSIQNAYWRIASMYTTHDGVFEAAPEQKQWLDRFTHGELMDAMDVLKRTIK